MSLKSKFLTLSIKEQVCITIVALTFFCILVTLGICCTLIYEFFKDNYRTKKLYFYNKYKDYIESSFYFHNFCFLRYEEVLRRIQKQVWKYHQTIFSFKGFTMFDNYSDAIVNYNDSIHKNISLIKTNNNNNKLFILYYLETGNKTLDMYIFEVLYQNTLYSYQSLQNLIISPGVLETLRIPGYNIPVVQTPTYINLNYSIIFGFNASNIHEMLIKIQGDSTNINDKILNNYCEQKLYEFIFRISQIYKDYNSQKLKFFSYMFNNSFIEIENIVNNGIRLGLIKNNPNYFLISLLGYFSIIDFSNSKFKVLSFGDDNNYYYSEANILQNYLYFFNKGLGAFIDTLFIPLYFENSTVISPGLCIIFMLKQKGFQLDNNTSNEFNNTIKKGKSIFENCFIYKDLIKSQQNINDILNISSTNFFTVNNFIYQGIIYLTPDDNYFPYYFMKFSYPNYNTLKDFQSDYVLLDQMDYYLFTSFSIPIKCSNYINQIYQNCFFIIILIILFMWYILLFINLLIFNQIIKDLIEPLLLLQYSVETSSLKDESIFNYEHDNIINELFGTCKELLNGQIDNENGLNNFNILSIPKDKDKNIDTNIYKKNFIINNEIMNELIDEQQNMMDYSKNIKLYEPKEINEKSKYFKKTKSNNNICKNGLSENNLIHIMDRNSKDIVNKKTFNRNSIIKNIENKDKEPYKKLFEIAEYLNYYRKKNYPNNIIIIGNNSNIDDSKKSKIKSKNNSSTKKNISYKKINSKNDIDIHENMESIKINMLDEQNISYLWYMEAKKKNNNSFNYNVNYNFEELFNEFNTSYEYKREKKKNK